MAAIPTWTLKKGLLLIKVFEIEIEIVMKEPCVMRGVNLQR